MTMLAFAVLLVLSTGAYAWNRQAAGAIRAGGRPLHSLTAFHGLYALLLVLVPVLLLILAWVALQGPIVDRLLMASLPAEALAGVGPGERGLILSEIKSIAGGRIFGDPEPWKLAAAEYLLALQQRASLLLVLCVALAGIALLAIARRSVSAEFRARQGAERIVMGLMIGCSVVAVFTTVGIFASLLFETIKFLQLVPLTEFLFGTRWEPQIPIREDQIAAAGAFGAVPVVLGTLVIMVIALTVAIPTGIFTAIYLNEFASSRTRAWAKPMLEILSGVPTVVYGFFAILVVAPALRSFGTSIGLPVSPNTALAAGSVMGIMVIPFISSFTDDALNAVPRSLRDGALALGATRAETMMNVLFPAAIPGIAGGILLAVSRAIGETMIVVMAAGQGPNLTANPLEAVTTVTVQIVMLITGDTEASTAAGPAFTLGFTLFCITLALNVVALQVVKRYREQYD